MKADRKNPVNSNLPLELTWSIIPFFMSMGIFFWSAYVYIDMHRVPANTLDIYVIGKQWMWHAQHPNGKRENNELHVPIGQPVKLIMISQDVIHSFYIPAFRIKQDVLPGRYTTMWFEATKEGEYHLFCAEYCGTEHSLMGGRVVVMPLADYQRWLDTDGPRILQNQGAAPGTVASEGSAREQTGVAPVVLSGPELFRQKGCVSCHTGQAGAIGPAMAGLYNSQRTLADGTTVTADEAYLRDSILNPNGQVAQGYQPVMPTYRGQLTEEEIRQLVEYIKSLGATQ